MIDKPAAARARKLRPADRQGAAFPISPPSSTGPRHQRLQGGDPRHGFSQPYPARQNMYRKGALPIQLLDHGAQYGLHNGSNPRLPLDFRSDALIDGGQVRRLAVVDDFSRATLAPVAYTSRQSCPLDKKVRVFQKAIIQHRTDAHLKHFGRPD
ncbi:hypothetical protein ACW9UM_18865 (plasmid) [Marinovum sp. KMM 9989]